MRDRDTVDTHGVSRRRLLIGGAAAAGAGWIAPAIVSAPAHAQGSALAWLLATTSNCSPDPYRPTCRSAGVWIQTNQNIFIRATTIVPGVGTFTSCDLITPARGRFFVGAIRCPPNPNLQIPPGIRTVVERLTSCPSGTVIETTETVATLCSGAPPRRAVEISEEEMPTIVGV